MPDKCTAEAANAFLTLSSCGLHLIHAVLSAFPVRADCTTPDASLRITVVGQSVPQCLCCNSSLCLMDLVSSAVIGTL